jgi:hypothetical protein
MDLYRIAGDRIVERGTWRTSPGLLEQLGLMALIRA